MEPQSDTASMPAGPPRAVPPALERAWPQDPLQDRISWLGSYPRAPISEPSHGDRSASALAFNRCTAVDRALSVADLASDHGPSMAKVYRAEPQQVGSFMGFVQLPHGEFNLNSPEMPSPDAP